MTLDISKARLADACLSLILYTDISALSIGSAIDIEFLNLNKELIGIPVIKQLESQSGIDISWLKGHVVLFISHGFDVDALANMLIKELNDCGCSTIKKTIKRGKNSANS